MIGTDEPHELRLTKDGNVVKTYYLGESTFSSHEYSVLELMARKRGMQIQLRNIDDIGPYNFQDVYQDMMHR